jgi:CrcB protein
MHQPAPWTQPVLLVLVLLGGTVGTGVRAWLTQAYPAGSGDWPWTTFAVNVLGSFLLGLLVSVLVRLGDDATRQRLRLALGTGVLGGFTTYSTFVVEVDVLVNDGQTGLGVAYALGSVALGVLAAVLGVLAGAAGGRR